LLLCLDVDRLISQNVAMWQLALAITLLAQVSAGAPFDSVFSSWATRNTPGCAAGVSLPDGTAIERGYGMADLEHGIAIRFDTIFEAGSVSKQFTAAAVLLLAHDRKLSLDDPVRKYLPELPDYGAPLTIRHMLMHTSGLRDWGSVVDIGGAPRWSRVYTQADVLALAARQTALNFPPGTQWSYSNTGYNLAALIVSRVSGMSFDDFVRTRICEPLKMTHSSWDSDHTRIVPNRAVGYAREKDGFHTFMPFEDVLGNRGLLTTVGDLLKWNQNFDSPVVGDRAFVQEQQTPGRFNDGRPHTYAFGLAIGQYKGVREVDHNGSTAGYRAELARFPDQHVSVAVLCNASSADPTSYAHAVADLYLSDHSGPRAQKATYRLTQIDIVNAVGLYRSNLTGVLWSAIITCDRLSGALS
jgi:CubicO group peptidase (beta-lactamase class C family)